MEYSPDADGFLNNRLTADADDREVRSTKSSNGTAWKSSYDSEVVRAALSKIEAGAKEHGTTPSGAGLRWLAFHSALGEKDGIILRASNVDELERNVVHVAQGPLPEELVRLIEDVRGELGPGRRLRG